MNRRIILSTLAAIVLFTVALIAGTTNVAAQPISWCGSGCYTVDLTNVPTTCFPLCIYTSWGGSAVVWPTTATPCYSAPGIYTECPVPALPVGTPLDWVNAMGVTIPGNVGQASFGGTSAGGCGLCAVLCTTTTLCLVIKVYPGPCPIAPLPCP